MLVSGLHHFPLLSAGVDGVGVVGFGGCGGWDSSNLKSSGVGGKADGGGGYREECLRVTPFFSSLLLPGSLLRLQKSNYPLPITDVSNHQRGEGRARIGITRWGKIREKGEKGQLRLSSRLPRWHFPPAPTA